MIKRNEEVLDFSYATAPGLTATSGLKFLTYAQYSGLRFAKFSHNTRINNQLDNKTISSAISFLVHSDIEQKIENLHFVTCDSKKTAIRFQQSSNYVTSPLLLTAVHSIK